MSEWIISSSAIILIVIALRGLLKGKISLRLQYGLWAIVLVRLLIPISFFQSDLSISNFVDIMQNRFVTQGSDASVQEYEDAYNAAAQRYEEQGIQISREQLRQEAQDQIYHDTYNQIANNYAQSGTVVPDIQIQTEAQNRVASISIQAMVTDLLPYLWIAGMFLVGGVLVVSNLHFTWKLRRTRQLLIVDEIPLKVFLTGYVATPCLFGIGKPDIYLTDEVLTDFEMRNHVLAHEFNHYRQKDHIWSVLRSICLVLHWYNPLVWAAAILSKQDAELACDEATIKTLGEDQRVAYGKTLIGMTCVKRDPRSLLLTATTMLGSKKTLKERISLIAAKPKTALYTLISCVLVAAIAVGCTFTGAPAKSDAELLEQCRQALEYIQNLEHFEITETHTSEDPDTMLAWQEGRYVHSGDDWYHFRTYPDWTWQYLYKDGQLFTKDITKAVPQEDIQYPEWTEIEPIEDFYGKHCWIMDLHWDGDKIEYMTYTGNGDGYEGGIFTPIAVSSDTEDGYDLISVVLELDATMSVTDVEEGTLWILTFCLDQDTGNLVELKNDILIEDAEVHIAGYNGGVESTDVRSTSTLTITSTDPDEVANIIDGIYFGEIVTVVPTPEDPTEPTAEPTEPPTEPTESNPEVTKFQELFTYENGYWYWRALGCIFEKPEDIDMSLLCYLGMENGQQSSDFTDEEIAFLTTQDIGIAGDETAWTNAHRLPREELNSVLQDHFGITLDNVTIPDGWVYYSETDAYYDVRYDAYSVVGQTVTDVQTDDNGLIYVYWTAEYITDSRAEERALLINPQMVMVLEEKADGGYLIYMNMPVDELLQSNEQTTENSERDIFDILFSAERLQADVRIGNEASTTYGLRADMEQPLRDLLSKYNWTQVEDDSFESSYAVLFIPGYIDETDTQFVDYWFHLRAIEDGQFLLTWKHFVDPFEYYILTPKDPDNSSQMDIINFVKEYFPNYDFPEIPD